MVEQFLDYLKLEKKYSKHTLVAYRNDLNSFQCFCVSNYNETELHSIGYHQIRSWIVFLVNQGLTNRSTNRKISSLKAYYSFLQKVDKVQVNPLAQHKALKVQKKIQIPFNREEVDTVVQNLSIANDFVSVRNKLIVELLYSTGIRRSELVFIKNANVDVVNKIIKVLGKRNKERLVTLLDSVVDTLKLYEKLKKDIQPKSEYLFVTEKGDKIYETLVYRIVNSYFSSVSNKTKKSPHILRHTFATELLNQGADLNSVKELLGHSSLASTQVYTHNSMKQLKKVFNDAHPRGRNK